MKRPATSCPVASVVVITASRFQPRACAKVSIAVDDRRSKSPLRGRNCRAADGSPARSSTGRARSLGPAAQRRDTKRRKSARGSPGHVGDDPVRELNGDRGIGLVVLDDEANRLPSNPARPVHHRFDRPQRCGLGVTEEREGPRQREDRVDVVRFGGADRERGEREREEGEEDQRFYPYPPLPRGRSPYSGHAPNLLAFTQTCFWVSQRIMIMSSIVIPCGSLRKS